MSMKPFLLFKYDLFKIDELYIWYTKHYNINT